jgi:hypothetical protein
MATLKLTMDKRRPYTDGRYPIIIRISNNQKSTSSATSVINQSIINQAKTCKIRAHKWIVGSVYLCLQVLSGLSS